MKLHQDIHAQIQAFTAYDAYSLSVNHQRFESSLIVMPNQPPLIWPVERFEALTTQDFAQLGDYSLEVILFGSGTRLRFPEKHLLAPLIQQQIGLETMDSNAACRTYNILATEGRKVLAAILLPCKNQ